MSESPKPTGAHFDRPLGFQACVPEYDYAGEIRQPSGGPDSVWWLGGLRKPPWFFPKSLLSRLIIGILNGGWIFQVYFKDIKIG